MAKLRAAALRAMAGGLSGAIAGAKRGWRMGQHGQTAVGMPTELQLLLKGPWGAFIDTWPEAMLVLAPDGRVLRGNAAAGQLYRLAPEALLGMNLADFSVPDLKGAIPMALAYVMGGANLRSPRAEGRRPDGSSLLVSSFLTPLPGADGQPVAVLVAMQNVERFAELMGELEQARRQASEANEAKSGFLAAASHELRTPLNAILGYVQLVLEEDPNLPLAEVAEDLGKVEKAGKHLLALIEDILDLSRIEAGRSQLAPEPFDLEALLKELADTMAPLVAQGGNRWRLELQGDLGVVEQDPTRLKQLLLNLLGNACKFTEGGEVALLAEREGDWVKLSVADTGPGIAPEWQDRLFEPFERGHPGVKTKREGAGLGLALVRRLADQMGGQLGLQSAVGEGACFTLRLPAQLLVSTSSEEAPSPLLPLALVVESDPMMRGAIAQSLEREGFRTVGASLGSEALSALRRHAPAWVVCDWPTFSSSVQDPTWRDALLEVKGLKVSVLAQLPPGQTAAPLGRTELLSAITSHLADPNQALVWSDAEGKVMGRQRQGNALPSLGPNQAWPLIVALQAEVSEALRRWS